MNRDERLKYLIMRCVACHRFLTKEEIISTWEDMEKDGAEKKKGICPCGGRQLKPSNLTPEEEEIYCSDEQKKRYYEDGIDDNLTRVWKLYDLHVKDKELGEEYQ